MLFVIFLHALCLHRIVCACECKQRASKVPPEGDERKNGSEETVKHRSLRHPAQILMEHSLRGQQP